MKAILYGVLIFLQLNEGAAKSPDLNLELKYEVADIAKEALKVESELLKKIKINSADHQLYFGKLLSIFYQYSKSKDSVSMMNCSRYEIKNLFQSQTKKSFSAIEKCEKNKSPEIVKFILNSSQIELEFFTSVMPAVVGLPATFLQKTARCTLDVKDKKLQSFTCHDLVYTKSTQEVLHLSKWIYKKDQDPLITADGMWVEELNNEKSIKIKVPLSGPIVVNEKQVRKPVELIKKEMEQKKAHSEITKPPQSVEQAAHESAPDQTPSAGQEAVPLDSEGRPERVEKKEPAQNSEPISAEETAFQEDGPYSDLSPEERQALEEERGMGATDPRNARGREGKNPSDGNRRTPEAPNMQIHDQRMQTVPVDENGQPLSN